MASRPVWSRNRPQITWRCRMACFYDVFDAYSTEKCYMPWQGETTEAHGA